MYKLDTNKDHQDVEVIVKANSENNLGINSFATIKGIKGMQFGRDIYSSMLRFEDLSKFLTVFPDVQRTVSKIKVGQIKNYVLSGISEEDAMRFFSGITVTCRSHIFYDDNNNQLAIDVNNSQLSINDGQHRFYGISAAIAELTRKLDNETDKHMRIELHNKIEELKNFVIPVVIFNKIGKREERQLFHDTNNLASRPSRSTTIKLSQTDLYSKIAYEICVSNKYMVHYGVETEKASIHPNNSNLILLTTIYLTTKEFLKTEKRRNKEFLTNDTLAEYTEKVSQIFDSIFEQLPNDLDKKGKYIVDKHYTFKGISKFYNQAVNLDDVPVENVLRAIREMDWTSNVEVWGKYGASLNSTGMIAFAGSGDAGAIAIYSALEDKLKEQNNPKLALVK